MVDEEMETAALLLGTDKSRGYCLEMLCASFLAGTNRKKGNSYVLLFSLSPLYEFAPVPQRQNCLNRIIKTTCLDYLIEAAAARAFNAGAVSYHRSLGRMISGLTRSANC